MLYSIYSILYIAYNIAYNISYIILYNTYYIMIMSVCALAARPDRRWRLGYDRLLEWSQQWCSTNTAAGN